MANCYLKNFPQGGSTAASRHQHIQGKHKCKRFRRILRVFLKDTSPLREFLHQYPHSDPENRSLSQPKQLHGVTGETLLCAHKTDTKSPCDNIADQKAFLRNILEERSRRDVVLITPDGAPQVASLKRYLQETSHQGNLIFLDPASFFTPKASDLMKRILPCPRLRERTRQLLGFTRDSNIPVDLDLLLAAIVEGESSTTAE